ncbi:MAG: nucleotidyltransferase substrate binding protein [Acidobacteriaceae bacterium]
MPLDLTPLKNAINRLTEALARFKATPDDTVIRDSVIKRFEFTYEVSHKMLRRFLAEYGADADGVSAMTFPELIRTANQKNLLRSDWPRWHDFRDARNRTAHTYEEAIAQAVLAEIPDFLEEAKHLYLSMQDGASRADA